MDAVVTMKLFAVCLTTNVIGHSDCWIEFFMAEDGEHATQQALDANDADCNVDVVCFERVPDPKTPDATVRSTGHIAFVRDTHGGFWEYYLHAGDIYRQTTVAPVMPDGRRAGRWFGKGHTKQIEHLMSIGVNPSAPVRV